MTEDKINKLAQGLVDGKRSVKILGIWDYKPAYMERGCLVRRSGGVGLALPKIPIKEGQPEEYQFALKIIKEVERIKSL